MWPSCSAMVLAIQAWIPAESRGPVYLTCCPSLRRVRSWSSEEAAKGGERKKGRGREREEDEGGEAADGETGLELVLDGGVNLGELDGASGGLEGLGGLGVLGRETLAVSAPGGLQKHGVRIAENERGKRERGGKGGTQT